MTRWARVVAGVVQDCLSATQDALTSDWYAPSFFAQLSPCPDDVQPGWTAVQGPDGAWSYAEPVPVVVAPSISSLAFLDSFPPAVKAAIYATLCPHAPELFGYVIEACAAGTMVLTDPRVLAGLGLVAASGFITPEGAAQVLGNSAPASTDRVTFDVSRATESTPARADAVRFDTARAVEHPSARADAVSFDTRNATTEP